MKDIGELNQLYAEADGAGLELFAEMRNNLLLVSGQHYAKKGSQFWNKMRDDQNIPREQKLRLVKNHIQKISKIYKNNILSWAPGVTVSPKNPSELSDVKAAEQHNSVWEDIKTQHKLKPFVAGLVGDFVDIGEMIVKMGYDYGSGRFMGYEAVPGEEGATALDENGEVLTRPVFAGAHVFEKVYGFNCLTDPAAETFESSRHVIIRKMVVTKDLQAKVTDPEMKKKIGDTADERYKVFQGSNGTYRDTKGMTMVREFYFRKCDDYPEGYYYITCSGAIMFEGVLPLGRFPIIYRGFDEESTQARARSIIRQARPWQAEINRAASKIAEHQITLGDDKLVLIGGSKIAHGGTAHGVKAINVTGSAPVVIPGRAGDQFVGYMEGQITELYAACNVREDSEEKVGGDVDPYARLFKSIKDKKKFSLYTDKVEGFLVEMADLALEYAKEYYTDDQLVPAVGRKEMVNIPEFKKSEAMSTQIKVEPAEDDVETKMGKQLVLNHAIQFIGPSLDRSDIGHLLKAMPYGVDGGAFEELTMDAENATNDILALDRGMSPEVGADENHDYILKKLTNRMKKGDFAFLPPQVQQNYRTQRDQRRQILAQQIQQAQAATAGFIPTGGYLVGCDMFVDVGGGKTPKRARIPYESLNWLMQKMDKQGTTQKSLHDQSMGDQAGVGAATQPAIDDAQGAAGARPPGGINGVIGMGASQPPPMMAAN